MSKPLLLSIISLSFFIICPRMAGMVHIIAKYSQVSLMYTALIGTVISIPLVLIMVFLFEQTGIWGALTFCIVTDFIAAFLMKNISIQAGLETLIIALFVIMGVKLAPIIISIFVK